MGIYIDLWLFSSKSWVHCEEHKWLCAYASVCMGLVCRNWNKSFRLLISLRLTKNTQFSSVLIHSYAAEHYTQAGSFGVGGQVLRVEGHWGQLPWVVTMHFTTFCTVNLIEEAWFIPVTSGIIRALLICEIFKMLKTHTAEIIPKEPIPRKKLTTDMYWRTTL